MMKRIAYFLAAALFVAAAGVVVYRTDRGGSGEQGVAGEPLVAGRGPARILLNEILFAPPDGQPQWVELVNAGGEAAALAGFTVENHAREVYALPESITLPAGGVLLVRFDGQTGNEPGTVHAAASTFLAPDGFIELSGSRGPVDRIAWGDRQLGAANVSRGGHHDDVTPGTSLGRVPRMITSDPLEWVSYAPQQTTPGKANPQPGVEILLPMDGAILTGAAGSLTWYPVAGAARYRVQLAADASFASPLLDQIVPEPQVTGPELARGSYVWRVQAIAADGTAAEYSAPSTLTVRTAAAGAARGRAMIDWLLPPLHAQSTPPPPIDDELPTVLDVPMIKQHKDTRMLMIETRNETGQHGWDLDHADLDTSDPADNKNCAVASIAMLAAFYGGRLSQDRINYEVFKDDDPGPQGDLKWGRGYSSDRIKQAITFALGREPSMEQPTDYLYTMALVSARIDAGVPMIACKNGHCVAVVGAGSSLEVIVINDPWRGTYLVPMRNLLGATVFVMAEVNEASPWPIRSRSDEPEVSRDSDGDGVVDFDETRRFHTNPQVKDTDGDGVADKRDVRAWVFDEKLGDLPPFLRWYYSDQDQDGKRMELDADADGGGCPDGMEDTNSNGKHEPGLKEYYNFDKDDDACVSGTSLMVHDTSSFYGKPQKTDGRTEIQFSLREVDGAYKGRAIVTHSFRMAETGLFAECGTSIVHNSEPYQYVVDVEGTVGKMPDGTVSVIVKAPDDWKPPIVRVVTTCPAVSPYEHDAGPTVGITGVLRNGVFDSRVNLPLDGYTGAIYIETHIRQSRQR